MLGGGGGDPSVQQPSREPIVVLAGLHGDDIEDEGYCPHCQKSEVLRDFCSCVNTERGQRTTTHCDCTNSCNCRTCRPWRHTTRNGGRGNTGRLATDDASMTSQVMGNDIVDSSWPSSSPHRRQQSQSFHSTDFERERAMAIAARNTDSRILRRRRTMSFSGPSNVRVFVKHSSFCECRGSGVGCQCGRMCHCE